MQKDSEKNKLIVEAYLEGWRGSTECYVVGEDNSY